MSSPRVAVVGAGVLGLSTALELTLRGARCTVFDPAPSGPSASTVAAGMLAPALESALDPVCRGRFALLRAARDLWPEFAKRCGAPAPERSGALWLGEGEAVAAALSREGAAFHPVDPNEMAEISPGLALSADEALFTSEDWRIDVRPALAALRSTLVAAGCEFRAVHVARASPGSVQAGAETFEADVVLVAAGPESEGFVPDAPELGALRPIKGELLRFPGARPTKGPVLRSRSGYLVPSTDGPVAGATMVEGASDRALSGQAAHALLDMAGALFPPLLHARAVHEAGVRAATPDGLPLVGRSAGGVWLAAGARRNGWLLAPLVARTLGDAITGERPGPWAVQLRPDRFS